MNSSLKLFFIAGSTIKVSPVSRIDDTYRIPRFICSACNSIGYISHIGYPNLDPSDVLDETELKCIRRSSRGRGTAIGDVIGLVRKLEAHFGVPVSEGTYFGCLKPRISGCPKIDVDFALVREIFIRRPAAEALRSQGLNFEYSSVGVGPRASEVDFVQIHAPIVAYGALSTGAVWCEMCYRITSGTTAVPPVLYDNPLIHQHSVFKSLNTGFLIFSGDFVSTAVRLGIKGFIEGETVFRIPVVSDPQLSQRKFSWP